MIPIEKKRKLSEENQIKLDEDCMIFTCDHLLFNKSILVKEGSHFFDIYHTSNIFHTDLDDILVQKFVIHGYSLLSYVGTVENIDSDYQRRKCARLFEKIGSTNTASR